MFLKCRAVWLPGHVGRVSRLPWFDPSTASPWGVLLLRDTSQLLMSSMTKWAGSSACLRCTRNWIFGQQAGLQSLLVHCHCRIPLEQMNRLRHKYTTLWLAIYSKKKNAVLTRFWSNMWCIQTVLTQCYDVIKVRKTGMIWQMSSIVVLKWLINKQEINWTHLW